MERNCTPHALTRVLKGHAAALIALGAHNMHSYHISDPQKCLNSAVSLLFLLLGDDALANTTYCDVTTVTKRYKKGNMSLILAKDLASQLKAPQSQNELYYLMITDAYLKSSKAPGLEKYFPGHVFCIERSCNSHSVFQSYIKQYDLDEYLNQTTQHVRGKEDLHALADGLVTLFSKDVWDKECTNFWRKLTMVHSEGFEGFKIKDTVLFCFRRIPLKNGIGSLRHIINNTLDNLAARKDQDFFLGASGLTNGDMKAHLLDMIAAI